MDKTSASPRLCEKPTLHSFTTKETKEKHKAKRKINPHSLCESAALKSTQNKHSKPTAFASFAPLREN